MTPSRKLAMLFLLVFSSNLYALDFIDPMRPPEYALKKYRLEKLKNLPPKNTGARKKPVEQQQWVLQSVIYSADRKHAIVNNQLVRKGDKVDGARVIVIKPGSVRLSYKGKAVNLGLNQYRPDSKKERDYSIKKKSHQENKI